MDVNKIWIMIGQLYAENQSLRAMVAELQAKARTATVASVPTEVNPNQADNATPEA